MVHSGLQFDGRPLEERHCYLGCVVKDNLQRGFYIRVVDPQVRIKHNFGIDYNGRMSNYRHIPWGS